LRGIGRSRRPEQQSGHKKRRPKAAR